MYNAVAIALRSGHRMQIYGIKLLFLSGYSAWSARIIRYNDAKGLNTFISTNY